MPSLKEEFLDRSALTGDPEITDIAGVKCALLSCCAAGIDDGQDVCVANLEALRRMGAEVLTANPAVLDELPQSSVFILGASPTEKSRIACGSCAEAYLRLDAEDDLAKAYAGLLDYPLLDEMLLGEVQMRMLTEALPGLIGRASGGYELEIDDLEAWVEERGLRDAFLSDRELWREITRDVKYGRDGAEFYGETRLYEPVMEALVKHGAATKETDAPAQ